MSIKSPLYPEIGIIIMHTARYRKILDPGELIDNLADDIGMSVREGKFTEFTDWRNFEHFGHFRTRYLAKLRRL
jgi:hypothetical protein